jgi:regulator of sigma E protease
MAVLTQIFAFIFAIFLLVTIHEFAHFIVAKYFGVKTLRFSIGFGKAIWKWYGKDGTEYVIAMLPLGGYVKLLDEREDKVPPEQLHLAFNRKPLWVRSLVLLAGPLSNWLLAIFLFWLVFIIGVEQTKPVIGKVLSNSIAAEAGLTPGAELIKVNHHNTPNWQKALIAVVYHMGEKDLLTITARPEKSQSPQTYVLNLRNWQVSGLTPEPLESLGIIPFQPKVSPLISKVVSGSAAEKAGLKVDDRIVAINGKPIDDWMTFIEFLQKNPQQTVSLQILRNDKTQIIPITVGTKYVFPLRKIGFIGVQTQPPVWPKELQYEQKFSLLSAWIPAFQETVLYSAFNFVVLGKMVVGHISLQGLGGPITIFTTAQTAFKQGVVVYLSFLAIMSTMLACINILPIPGLDGGHLLYFLIEAIRGKPVSTQAQLLAWRLGMIFLILIMVQATVNDVLRLF